MASSTSETLQNIKIHKVPNFDVWKGQYGQINGIGADDIVVIPPTSLENTIKDWIPNPEGTNTPLMDGTASTGSATTWSKSDHVHPTDTTRAPTNHASTNTTYGKGTSSNYGHVKLSDSTTTTSGANNGTAATPTAVKAVYDLANSKEDKSAIGTIITTVRTDLENNWHICDGSEYDPILYPDFANLYGRKNAPILETAVFSDSNIDITTAKLTYDKNYVCRNSNNRTVCFINEDFNEILKTFDINNLPRISGSETPSTFVGGEKVNNFYYLFCWTSNSYILFYKYAENDLIDSPTEKYKIGSYSITGSPGKEVYYNGEAFYFLGNYNGSSSYSYYLYRWVEGTSSWKTVSVSFGDEDASEAIFFFENKPYSLQYISSTYGYGLYQAIYNSQNDTFSWTSMARKTILGQAVSFNNTYFCIVKSYNSGSAKPRIDFYDRNQSGIDNANYKEFDAGYIITLAYPSFDGSQFIVIMHPYNDTTSWIKYSCSTSSIPWDSTTVWKKEKLVLSDSSPYIPNGSSTNLAFQPQFWNISNSIHNNGKILYSYVVPEILTNGEYQGYIKMANNPIT